MLDTRCSAERRPNGEILVENPESKRENRDARIAKEMPERLRKRLILAA
jgi:hypothetical protein